MGVILRFLYTDQNNDDGYILFSHSFLCLFTLRDLQVVRCAMLQYICVLHLPHLKFSHKLPKVVETCAHKVVAQVDKLGLEEATHSHVPQCWRSLWTEELLAIHWCNCEELLAIHCVHCEELLAIHCTL